VLGRRRREMQNTLIRVYDKELRSKVITAYISGKSAQDISEELNVPYSTLKTWIRRYFSNDKKFFLMCNRMPPRKSTYSIKDDEGLVSSQKNSVEVPKEDTHISCNSNEEIIKLLDEERLSLRKELATLKESYKDLRKKLFDLAMTHK
jgi:transposase-like protein